MDVPRARQAVTAAETAPGVDAGKSAAKTAKENQGHSTELLNAFARLSAAEKTGRMTV